MAYTNNDYGPADLYKSKFFKTIFDTETGNPDFKTSGGMPRINFSGSSRAGFDPADFPTELDGSKKSYGLPSIWQGDMTTAETNEWANSMKTNKNIPQFMQNTFTDPMAERKGLGVYNMDFSNALNRPAEQLTPGYAAAKTIFNTPANTARMKAGVNNMHSYQNLKAVAAAPKASKGFTQQSAQYSNFGRGR